MITSAYGGDPNQFGELTIPTPGLPCPVVMFIHGGFWRAHRTITHANHFCEALNAAGIATWSIEYRRIGQPGGGFPGTLEDVRAAALHLPKLAAEHNLDISNLVLVGHSAGGHLALWLAAQHVIEIRRVVSLAGVADLRRASQLGVGNGVVDDFLNGAPFEQACPTHMLPIKAPQILIHGTADDLVPIELTENFSAASENAEIVRLPGTGHALIDSTAPEWPVILSHLI